MPQGVHEPVMPRCAARRCEAVVKQGQPFCRACFLKLPQGLREQIWLTSRDIAREQYDGDVHRDAIMSAIRWTWEPANGAAG